MEWLQLLTGDRSVLAVIATLVVAHLWPAKGVKLPGVPLPKLPAVGGLLSRFTRVPGDEFRASLDGLRQAASRRGVFANCEELKLAFEQLEEHGRLIDRIFPSPSQQPAEAKGY